MTSAEIKNLISDLFIDTEFIFHVDMAFWGVAILIMKKTGTAFARSEKKL